MKDQNYRSTFNSLKEDIVIVRIKSQRLCAIIVDKRQCFLCNNASHTQEGTVYCICKGLYSYNFRDRLGGGANSLWPERVNAPSRAQYRRLVFKLVVETSISAARCTMAKSVNGKRYRCSVQGKVWESSCIEFLNVDTLALKLYLGWHFLKCKNVVEYFIKHHSSYS